MTPRSHLVPLPSASTQLKFRSRKMATSATQPPTSRTCYSQKRSRDSITHTEGVTVIIRQFCLRPSAIKYSRRDSIVERTPEHCVVKGPLPSAD